VRKAAWLVVFWGTFFFLASCGLMASRYPVQIYFPDKNDLLLVPVTRFLFSPPTPELLLEELKKGPQDRFHLLPVFPKGIAPSIEVSKDVVRINLTVKGAMKHWPPLLEPAVLATFQQLPQYHYVQFLVNGNASLVGEGEELGTESLQDFHVNDNWELSDSKFITRESRLAVVYYRLRGTPYLVPVTIRVSPKRSYEEVVLEALEDNPKLPWILQSPLTAGSEVFSVSHPAPDIIEMTVKFKGTSKEKALAKKALLLTFGSFPGVKYVRIRMGFGFFGWRPLQKKPRSVNIEEGYGE
jgi:hypothetical protein